MGGSLFLMSPVFLLAIPGCLRSWRGHGGALAASHGGGPVANHHTDSGLATLVMVLWVIVVALAVSVWLRPWPDVLFRTDFVSFWTGGVLVREGVGPGLFDMERQRALQRGLRLELAATDAMRHADFYNPYHNPPPLALPFVPLTLLPMPWAYALWWAVSLSAFLVAFAVCLRGAPFGRTLAVGMLSFAGVGATLLEGQVNGLFALALAAGQLAMVGGNGPLGGALVGVLWLKPQYAWVFLVVFLAKRRWAEALGMAGAGLVVGAISMVMIGVSGLLSYLEVLRQIGEFHPPASSLISPERMVNWRALLTILWQGVPGATGSLLVAVLGMGTALLSLLAWRGRWDPRSPRFPLQMLVAALAAVISSPHSHFHGTVLLLAPVALSFARPMKGVPLERGWGPLLLLGYLLALVLFPFRQFSWLLAPYFLALMVFLILRLRSTDFPLRTGSSGTTLRRIDFHVPEEG